MPGNSLHLACLVVFPKRMGSPLTMKRTAVLLEMLEQSLSFHANSNSSICEAVTFRSESTF